MFLIQPHPDDKHRRDLAEISSPAQRIFLRVVGWEGAFFEAINNESVLEAEFQLILDGTLEIELRFRLVAQSKPFGLIGCHIA